MKILAIETSSAALSLALLCDQEVFSIHEILPLQQAQKILLKINDLITEANIRLEELDAISFGQGPGSFTGLRIAAGIAQGLAFGLDKPVIPISSLQALSLEGFNAFGWRHLLIAIDARIQEVYFGRYAINAAGIPILQGKEIVTNPQHILIPEGEWYGMGNGWALYAQKMLRLPIAMDTERLPNACAILKLACYAFQNKNWISAEKALPVYIRDEVAKKNNIFSPVS